jgi:hypothetical protein
MELSEDDKLYYEQFVGASALHQQCERSVIALHKKNKERELDEWAEALNYATPDMPAFEIILGKVEDLVDSIDKANAILKLI